MPSSNHRSQEEILKGDDMILHEVISSKDESKAEGWSAVIAKLPQLMSSKGSTTRELIGLHELVTYRTEFPGVNADMGFPFREGLCLNDHPDADLPAVVRGMRNAYQAAISSHHSFECTEEELRGFLPFDIDLRVDFRSDIRTLGTRKYPDGREVKVFNPHILPFYTAEGTKFYLGLTYKLDELYEELCQRYDAMWSRATDPKQYLLAELYLGMIGTRLLHPMWDGNGRSFAAHMMVSFNRMGLPVREFPREKDIMPEQGDDSFLLSYVSEKLMEKIIGPFLLTEEELGEVATNPLMRNAYMKKLHSTLADVVKRGLIETEFHPFLLAAYHQLRVWLHQKRYLPYTENSPEPAIDQPQLTVEQAERLREKGSRGELTPEDFDWSNFVL